MLRYLLRRIALALPTLLVISLITFGLSKLAPVDPVKEVYGVNLSPTLDPEAHALVYRQNAAKLGLDKPAFYFSITTPVVPDTAHLIFPPDRRKTLLDLAAQCGNWGLVSHYSSQLSKTIRAMERTPDSLLPKARLRFVLSALITVDNQQQLSGEVQALDSLLVLTPADQPEFKTELLQLRDAAQAVCTSHNTAGLPVPAFHWNGFDNQYDHWVGGMLVGDFGVSFKNDKNPVWEELRCYVPPTLLLNGLSILLAYLIAIPLGVYMAREKGRASEAWTRRLLLFLYALPTFWVGGILILWFATPGYGFDLIHGIAPSPWCKSGMSFWKWCSGNSSKFILPVVTLTLHALAVFAMQMRGSMLDALAQDFVRTARAKGVPEERVYWHHAFRNALFPIITVFASVFPAVFAGSLVIEYMFGFPGMGTRTQASFIERDYPVLFAIMMIAAVLTIVGNIVADVLFTLADPRVRLGKKDG